MSKRKSISIHKRLPKRLKKLSLENAATRQRKYRNKKSAPLDIESHFESHFESEQAEVRKGHSETRNSCIHCSWAEFDECRCEDFELVVDHKMVKLIEDLKNSDTQKYFHALSEENNATIVSSINVALPNFIHDLRHNFESAANAIRKSVSHQITEIELMVNAAINGEHTTSTQESFWLMKLLVKYSPFWIRDFKAWNGGSAKELVEFLFVSQDVPRTLLDLLIEHIVPVLDGHINAESPVHWLIILGQGGNLQKASRYFNWEAKGKYQAALFQAANDREACSMFLDNANDTSPIYEYWFYRDYNDPCCDTLFHPLSLLVNYAEVIRRGGDLEFFLLLHEANRWIEINLLDEIIFGPRKPRTEFWSLGIDWVLKHRKQDAQQINWREFLGEIFALGIDHVCSKEEARAFWKGRSVKSIRRFLDNRRLENEMAWKKRIWSCKSWNRTINLHGQRWRVVELTNSRALVKDGIQMKHCVGTFEAVCQSGKQAIFSLLRGRKSIGTIRVHMATHRVIEAKGPCNADLAPEVLEVIGVWAKDTFGGSLDLDTHH